MRIERELLPKEKRAKDIVNAHFERRRKWFPNLRSPKTGKLLPVQMESELSQMRTCISVRQEALRRNKVRGNDLNCVITKEAEAGRTRVNSAMMAEFQRRLRRWWELHKNDDPDDAPDNAQDDLQIPQPWKWRATLP